jgi:hypothetical protein
MNLERTVNKLKKELVSSPMDNTSALTIKILDVALQFEDTLWLTTVQAVRTEREKWLPLYEAVKELVAIGDLLVEQEGAFMRIGEALDELKRQDEEGQAR